MICDSLGGVSGLFSQHRDAEIRTRKSEERVRFRRHADSHVCRLGLVVELCLPVVHLVLLRYRQIALDTAGCIEKFNLSPPLHETVCDFELGLEFPRRHALLLYCQKLR